jgi:hypothetical protein
VVFRLRQPHQGIILLRLGDYAALDTLTQRSDDVLARYGDRLDHFTGVIPVQGRRSITICNSGSSVRLPSRD